MRDKPFAVSSERNAAAILEVLHSEFRDCAEVLEIGSGTGQHAVHFAASLDHLHWQSSDLDENHPGIRAWIEDSGLHNIAAPLSLDVRRAVVTQAGYDCVYSANTAHIMSYGAVTNMFALVGKALRPEGVFCLYGPFRVAGRFNTDSNEAFDASLWARNPDMGIRDLLDLDSLGAQSALSRQRLYAMPSNNNIAVWRKVPGRVQ